jgi:molybdopterin converting factor subunit 1
MSSSAKVLFFANIKDIAGLKETTIEFPEGTCVRGIKKMLIDHFPGLKATMDSALVSINHEYASDESVVPDSAEIALFPPVSGGLDSIDIGKDQPSIFLITRNEIDINRLIAQITLPTTGAVCFFTGMVRAITQRGNPHETIYLEYEAYEPMAEAKMQQIASEIRSRWPTVEGIAIIQRVGRLDSGTLAVVIACSAAHRDTGVFEAARYGIDRLKEIVPIWKKEVGPKGETWVDGDYIIKPGE